MKKQLYDAIYRLFNEMNYGLTINVGQVTLRLYYPEKGGLSDTVWNKGIRVNNRRAYTVGDLFTEGLGPGTYAQLFAGDYDIINGLAEVIYMNEF